MGAFEGRDAGAVAGRETCLVAPTSNAGGLAPTADAGGMAPTADDGGLAPTTDAGGLAPTVYAWGLAPTGDARGLAPTATNGSKREDAPEAINTRDAINTKAAQPRETMFF